MADTEQTEPDDSPYVRVRDKQTGHHLSVLRTQLARTDGYEELKQPATYADGTPLPVKYKTTVARSTAKKTASSSEGSTPTGQSAETPKE